MKMLAPTSRFLVLEAAWDGTTHRKYRVTLQYVGA